MVKKRNLMGIAKELFKPKFPNPYDYDYLVFGDAENKRKLAYVGRVPGVTEDMIKSDEPCLAAVVGDVLIATCENVFEKLEVEYYQTYVTFEDAIAIYNLVYNIKPYEKKSYRKRTINQAYTMTKVMGFRAVFTPSDEYDIIDEAVNMGGLYPVIVVKYDHEIPIEEYVKNLGKRSRGAAVQVLPNVYVIGGRMPYKIDKYVAVEPANEYDVVDLVNLFRYVPFNKKSTRSGAVE